MATLYVIEQGAEISCDGERLVVRRGSEQIGSAPISIVDDLLILGNVGLTTPAIKRLLDRGIDVTFLTVEGRYHGRLVGPTTAHAALRRAQYRRADEQAWALQMAQRCVRGKLRNQRVLLQRFARNRAEVDSVIDEAIDAMEQLTARVERTTTIPALLGVEGSATARYFRGWRALIGPDWSFAGRQRRPPPDPLNVLLSLGYTVLAHKITGAVQAVGLDPYQGYLHQQAYNRPSLALDLMEEFRPLIIDSLVLRCCGDGRLTSADFTEQDNPARPIVFGDAGCRRFISAIEERVRTAVTHPEGADSRPGKVDYGRAFLLQARRLARAVQDGTAYEPFIAR